MRWYPKRIPRTAREIRAGIEDGLRRILSHSELEVIINCTQPGLLSLYHEMAKSLEQNTCHPFRPISLRNTCYFYWNSI